MKLYLSKLTTAHMWGSTITFYSSVVGGGDIYSCLHNICLINLRKLKEIKRCQGMSFLCTNISSTDDTHWLMNNFRNWLHHNISENCFVSTFKKIGVGIFSVEELSSLCIIISTRMLILVVIHTIFQSLYFAAFFRCLLSYLITFLGFWTKLFFQSNG